MNAAAALPLFREKHQAASDRNGDRWSSQFQRRSNIDDAV